MDKIFKALMKFWGDVGYLYWSTIVENNSKQFTDDDKLFVIGLIELLNDDKSFTVDGVFILTHENEHYELLNRYLYVGDEYRKSEIVEMLADNINEKFFTKVLKQHSTSDTNEYYLKYIDIQKFEDIEPGRWMSFSKSNSSMSSLFGQKVIIIARSSIPYVDTNGYADYDEILINSDDLLKIINDENYVKLLDDNLPILAYNFFKDLCKGNGFESGIPGFLLNTLRSLEMYQGEKATDYNLEIMYNQLLNYIGVMMQEFDVYKQTELSIYK